MTRLTKAQATKIQRMYDRWIADERFLQITFSHTRWDNGDDAVEVLRNIGTAIAWARALHVADTETGMPATSALLPQDGKVE